MITTDVKGRKVWVESPINEWFGLSYAHFLTIPRLVMEAMPLAWQDTMRGLLEELDQTFDWRPKDGCYWVYFRDRAGRLREPPLSDYRRGSVEDLRPPASEDET